METLKPILDGIYFCLSSLGALVILWGAIGAVRDFLSLKRTTPAASFVRHSEPVRERFVAHLLLGLEFFIAGDIISSVLRPSWQRVGMLAAIVAIRTVLSVFLRMEVNRGEHSRDAARPLGPEGEASP